MRLPFGGYRLEHVLCTGERQPNLLSAKSASWIFWSLAARAQMSAWLSLNSLLSAVQKIRRRTFLQQKWPWRVCVCVCDPLLPPGHILSCVHGKGEFSASVVGAAHEWDAAEDILTAGLQLFRDQHPHDDAADGFHACFLPCSTVIFPLCVCVLSSCWGACSFLCLTRCPHSGCPQTAPVPHPGPHFRAAQLRLGFHHSPCVRGRHSGPPFPHPAGTVFPAILSVPRWHGGGRQDLPIVRNFFSSSNSLWDDDCPHSW